MSGAERSRRFRERHPKRARESRRRWRVENQTADNAAANRRYRERMVLVGELLGTRCQWCGTTEGRMDSHHVDPGAKVFSLSQAGAADPQFLAEVAKCIRVCVTCHARHHIGATLGA